MIGKPKWRRHKSRTNLHFCLEQRDEALEILVAPVKFRVDGRVLSQDGLVVLAHDDQIRQVVYLGQLEGLLVAMHGSITLLQHPVR